MKIDGFQVSKRYETYSANSSKAANVNAGDQSRPDKTDRVEISAKAADMNEATALKQGIRQVESPDARQARIGEIKKLIDAGQYNVPTKAVAQSILVGSNLDIRA